MYFDQYCIFLSQVVCQSAKRRKGFIYSNCSAQYNLMSVSTISTFNPVLL